MKKILDGFTHRRGMHCDTTSLRDVFLYAGHDMPESALFGMGEGLGFYYWESKNLRHPAVGGRIKPLELDRRVCRNLGVSLRIRTSTSPRRAYDAMKAMLAEDTPVMIRADIFYLKYRRSNHHCGAHNIVVAGLDEEAGIAYVADRIADGLIELPVSQLIDARSSPHKPFPPRNAWFEFGFPVEVRPDPVKVMRTIGMNAVEMLNSDVRNVGVGGIYYFASCLRRWKDGFTKPELKMACDAAYGAIQANGTGGGLYRHMYAEFLEYARGVTGFSELEGVAAGYHEAGRLWSEAAMILKSVPCGCASLSEASILVEEIAAKEHELLTDLLCVANLCCKNNGRGKTR
ncbi:hypothetical protein Mtc_0656 [Methanocella conradii HZ254]|uniref:Butirosin biosynthesis protein H N-terminal domain-containing protein n=1 Tax=Methanocella conradii (strain DSM 24694 / JCM 17849 / CGMCC 1.5162 / HZ254) TaxID=1041930 RepID=H8I6V0_METCZ|nr:BtrH N-terminal domain-containing protein [Methanocella conradii]AFC99420.1 hypothetical protein Mtc_0656 [Methanocella conradii HZ254]MDI6897976.1 BtrH N-terminal domain-containing protein [Methanocella conradii]